MENKNKEKERTVHTVGHPSIEQLSKDEQWVFYGTLLICITEYLKQNKSAAGCYNDGT